jgi:hypothetical protein
MSCNSFAAERMSETVWSCWPPSKADASFKFGVIISAIGKSSSLHIGTRKVPLPKEMILDGNYMERKCKWVFFLPWTVTVLIFKNNQNR